MVTETVLGIEQVERCTRCERIWIDPYTLAGYVEPSPAPTDQRVFAATFPPETGAATEHRCPRCPDRVLLQASFGEAELEVCPGCSSVFLTELDLRYVRWAHRRERRRDDRRHLGERLEEDRRRPDPWRYGTLETVGDIFFSRGDGGEWDD